MSDKISWQIRFALSLLAISVLFYLLHYLIFKDINHIFRFLISQTAFVFIQVLLVTLVLHQLLESRQKASRLNKLNMIVGSFFSEVGTTLLETLSDCDLHSCDLNQELMVTENWDSEMFDKVCRQLKAHDYKVQIPREGLRQLKEFLTEKREFLLRLLENPNLMEHESFTDLLWAVFHLTEELASRKNLVDTPLKDYEHLLGDVNRVYASLTSQWLDYMKHLQAEYPFLFSFALRTNPFNPQATPEIK